MRVSNSPPPIIPPGLAGRGTLPPGLAKRQPPVVTNPQPPVVQPPEPSPSAPPVVPPTSPGPVPPSPRPRPGDSDGLGGVSSFNINLSVSINVQIFGVTGGQALLFGRPVRFGNASPVKFQYGVALDGRGGVFALVGPSANDLLAIALLERLERSPFEGVRFSINSTRDALLSYPISNFFEQFNLGGGL